MSKKAFSIFMIAGMIICWSIYYAASKVVVGVTGSPYLAGLLLRTSALIYLTVQVIIQKKAGLIFKQGKAVFILILIGVFGFLLDLFANMGYAHGSLSTGTALLKTDVLMVNLATVIVYKKKLYLSDWLGTGIMLLGVLLVLGINFGEMSFSVYDLFFIASALCVTANAFIIKTAQDKYKSDSDMIGYYNNFTVLVLFLLGSAISGALTPAAFDLSPKMLALIALGGFGQAGIYFFYYRNLKTNEVWVVKLYLLLMPIVSCFIGVAFLGEVLTGTKILGILIVLAGAAVILLRGKLNKIN